MDGHLWLPVCITVSRDTLKVTDVQYDWCPVESVRRVVTALERIGHEMLNGSNEKEEDPHEAV